MSQWSTGGGRKRKGNDNIYVELWYIKQEMIFYNISILVTFSCFINTSNKRVVCLHYLHPNLGPQANFFLFCLKTIERWCRVFRALKVTSNRWKKSSFIDFMRKYILSIYFISNTKTDQVGLGLPWILLTGIVSRSSVPTMGEA